MPSVNVTVDHDLDQSEAVERMKHLVGDFKAQYADSLSDVRESWESGKGLFSFAFRGMPISGEILVQEGHVSLDVKLPLLASFFKDRLAGDLRQRTETLLA